MMVWEKPTNFTVFRNIPPRLAPTRGTVDTLLIQDLLLLLLGRVENGNNNHQEAAK